MRAYRRFTPWFLSALCLVVSLNASAACSVSMRWNVDPPFFSFDPRDGAVSGLDYELAAAALGRLGCTLTLVREPWARAVVSLRDGRIDLITSTYKTDLRADFANFSEASAFVSPNVLFFRRGEFTQWKISELSDLARLDFRVGSQLGVRYGTDVDSLLDELKQRNKSLMISNRQSLWKMLKRNRVDGVIADLATGSLEAPQIGGPELVDDNVVMVSSEPAYFAFSKQSVPRDFVERFDRAFQALKSDGTYQRIVSKFLCRTGRQFRAHDRGKLVKLDWPCTVSAVPG